MLGHPTLHLDAHLTKSLRPRAETGSAAFVNAAWLSSASQPTLEALDQVLPGGFKAVWPEFAKYNWNQGSVDDYRKWDGLNDRAAPAGGAGALELSANPDFALPLALGLPRLSATYKYFSFDESVRGVAFWNGGLSGLDRGSGAPNARSSAARDATRRWSSLEGRSAAARVDCNC